MNPFFELARISAERMLNGVVEGVVVAMFVGLLLHLMGRRNSGTRFAVLLAALFSIAALPLLHLVRGTAASSAGGGALWAVTVPSLWAAYVVLAWAAIAVAGLLRVAFGLWQLRKLRALSAAIDAASLDSAVQETLREFQPLREVRLAVSEKLTVPAAIGFFHPMIVLPKWTLHELSTAELNSILIHELAHLQRRDDWTNLAQKVLRALLFFHPAVWWIEPQLSLEREMACDDVVLSRTANPRAYAECLVTVAERSFMRRGLALAQAAVSKMRQTTLRVSQILDDKRSAATRVWKPALALVAVASGVMIVGLARAPELVAFRESAPPSSLASAAVPMSLAKDPAASSAAKAVLTSFKPKRIGQSRIAVPKTIEAELTPPSQGMEILAKMSLPASAQPVSAQDDSSAETLFVVMRTGQFGPSGASWTIRVWRFTVLKPEQIPVGLKVPAKST
jgi:beta-lactamase regulating signal transducer with metallopeptidase domain